MPKFKPGDIIKDDRGHVYKLWEIMTDNNQLCYAWEYWGNDTRFKNVTGLAECTWVDRYCEECMVFDAL